MKNYLALSSLLTLSFMMSSSAAIASWIVPANPAGMNVEVVCPGVHGTTNVLTNFGGYIAGYGTELLLSSTNPIYFTSDTLHSGIPHKLTNYDNDGTDYDSTNGQAMCFYKSSNAIEPDFYVSYYLTNGAGGAIDSQSNNAITIVLPIGFKKA